MIPERSEDGASRLLDAAAIALFAAHAALRVSLRGGDGSWGSNLSTHLLIPLAAAVWLIARALERRLSWRLTGFEIPLAVLGVVALVSTFGAWYRLAAMDGAAGLLASLLAVPLAVHAFGPAGRNHLVGLLAALVAVIALYGVVQYVQLGDLQQSAEARHAIERTEDPSELQGRVGAREPWSTLNYPNTFAGFLVFLIPFIAGLGIDARSRLARGAAFIIAAAGAFGVWASGSLGGAVAAGAALAAFAALEVMRRRPAWRRPLLKGAGGVVVLALLTSLAGPLSPNVLAKRSEAIAIRDVYWDSAFGVAKSNLLGVGLNNFEDHYYLHKDDRQEEVRQVHNDYLQVLAELGIAGLLAFLAILGVGFATGLKPAVEEPAEAAPRFRLPICLGLGMGWLVAFGFQGVFGDLAIAALLGAVGIGAYHLFSRPDASGPFARAGLVAGLAGVAVHFLVDFDFTDPAFRHAFFLGLAAIALTARLEPPGQTGAGIPAIAGILLLALALPLASVVAPRFLDAEEKLSAAAAAEAEGRHADSDRLLEEAAAANPLDPDPPVRRALGEFQRWMAQGSGGDMSRADLVITVLEDGLRRRPLSGALEARLAEVYEAMSYRSVPGSGLDQAAAGAYRVEAERHARRAVSLYPTRAYHQYLLARILDGIGRNEEAAIRFREALRLGEWARRVPRLALDGVQRALATLKTTGETEKSAGILRDWKRAQAERRGFGERWRARLPLLTPAEKSIVDAAGESQ